MGVGIYPAFKPNPTVARFDTDGKVLAMNFEELDFLCRELRIRPFSSFGDNRSLPDNFRGDPGEYFANLEPFDEWYPSSQGVVVFSALASHISDNPQAARRFAQPEDLVFELRCLESCVKVAEEAKAKFHLDMA